MDFHCGILAFDKSLKTNLKLVSHKNISIKFTRLTITNSCPTFMLGPDIWNIDYDAILRLKDLPEGVFLVG